DERLVGTEGSSHLRQADLRARLLLPERAALPCQRALGLLVLLGRIVEELTVLLRRVVAQAADGEVGETLRCRCERLGCTHHAGSVRRGAVARCDLVEDERAGAHGGVPRAAAIRRREA